MGSRIAVVGANGSGKSTLLKAVLGELEFSGTFWRHQHLRVSFVSQHSVEVLKDAADMTPVAYFMDRFHLPTELKVRCRAGG